jgi:hypothetical protein
MPSVTIDYSRTQQRTRLIKGKPRIDTYILMLCSCGTAWYVRQDRVKRVRQCYPCSQYEKALKGSAATIAKYGLFVAVRHTRQWRLEHPTDLEQIVSGWLDTLHVPYEREYWFQTGASEVFLLDFLVNGTFAIEVNGAYWHESAQALERDERKAEALRYADIPLLVLSEADILNGQGYTHLHSLLVSLTHPLASTEE